MIYAPMDLCRTFLALGMVSESGLWIVKTDMEEHIPMLEPECYQEIDCWSEAKHMCHDDHYPAFHPWDLVGTSEQAKRNAQAWWGLIPTYEDPCDFCKNESRWLPAWEYHRHAALDAEDVWAYVQGTSPSRGSKT